MNEVSVVNNISAVCTLKKVKFLASPIKMFSSVSLCFLLSSGASYASVIIDEQGQVISSDLTVNGHLNVAQNNDASLVINNGATVNLRDGNLIGGVAVGSPVGVSGELTVTGEGTRVITYTYLVAGSKGNGIINILDGGRIEFDHAMSYVGIGGNSGGDLGRGELNISGAGSTLAALSEISIGYTSEGYLSVTDGGYASSDAALYIGRGNMSANNASSVNAKGYVYVGGPDSRIDADRVFVGTYGSGSMLIADGGVVNSTAGNNTIAYANAVDKSVAIVTGENSLWSTQKNLTVGQDGKAELFVTDGGKVSAGNINIAAASSSVGTLNVGSAAGEAATAAGYLDSPTIKFGAGKGTLVLNHTNTDYLLAAAISGKGKVDIYQGTTILSGANSYSGPTTLYGGTLSAGADNTLSAASTYQVNAGATLDLHGYSQTIAELDNSGVITLGELGNTTLNVTGNYSGNNGLINFSGILNGDDSITDRLIIDGNTSGTTRVSVNNLGGSGANTVNGIELIGVNGISDGEFVQAGRIVAGAYEYILHRGEDSNAANWYLSSRIDKVHPVFPIIELPGESGLSEEHINRPEAGSYMSNLAAANSLFITRLHDRQGETQYIDAETGERRVTSMWLRNEGGQNRSRDNSGQLQTKSDRYVLMIGGDIAEWHNGEDDGGHIGIMAGYANNRSTTHSRISGYSAKGSVDGYSIGMYGTWYSDEQNKSGLYLDSWIQYDWFHNRVKGQELDDEKYDSSGISASFEGGYTYDVDHSGSYFVQPKVQATWMGVKAEEHRETNGTHVSSKGHGNLQTRLGMRVFIKSKHQIAKADDRIFKPFVEANWIHNTRGFSTQMDGTVIKQAGASNIAELKVGIEGQLNNKLNIWTNIAQQQGDKSYRDTAAMLGVKYNF